MNNAENTAANDVAQMESSNVHDDPENEHAREGKGKSRPEEK